MSGLGVGLGLAFAGFFLGLLGGGGGILVVPLLIFGSGLSPGDAARESLLLVGAGAAFGVLLHARRGRVEGRLGALFALPAFVALLAVREGVLPAISDPSVRDSVVFYSFLAVMAVSAFFMLRPPKVAPVEASKKKSWGRALAGGLVSGTIMGMTGAGGGFVIVPALTQGLRVPMERAVGTSLWVITLNAALSFWVSGGFAAQAHTGGGLRLVALLAGVMPGFWLGSRLSGPVLRKAFGVLTLAVAAISLVMRVAS
jgi:hypothetical protein